MPGLRQRIKKAWDVLTNKRVPATIGNSGQRMYEAARLSRLTADWGITSNGSADAELSSSLTQMRSRSRALCRDVSYAKRAKTLVVNNVIGSGIGMQAQVYTTRDELNTRVNDEIEYEWCEWSKGDSCHTGGRLDFSNLERALKGQIFEAGEVFVRKHYRRFGNSRVPFALEMIEAERIADDLMSPVLVGQAGNEIRMGIEVDAFKRPVAYYIRKRHPSELRFDANRPDEIERVPADQIIHLAIVDRWPQTRGEPWMSTVVITLKDVDGYTEAEITRARSQASVPWTIETPNDADSFGVKQSDGSVEMSVQAGTAKRLNPGEKMNVPTVNAPNPALEGFMRYLLRDIAAGTNTDYASLSCDYSQSNYSSSRLALLDSRDWGRALQSWFIKNFREPIHREWMQQAALAGVFETFTTTQWALDREKFEAVRFRPRGWGWVDPTKEVDAFKSAVRNGFMTLQDVASVSGADIEEIFDQRKKEIELADEAGLVLDTDPAQVANTGVQQAPDTPAAQPDTPPNGDTAATDEPAPRRVFSFQR